jgi:hypothetical protein
VGRTSWSASILSQALADPSLDPAFVAKVTTWLPCAAASNGHPH